MILQALLCLYMTESVPFAIVLNTVQNLTMKFLIKRSMLTLMIQRKI